VKFWIKILTVAQKMATLGDTFLQHPVNSVQFDVVRVMQTESWLHTTYSVPTFVSSTTIVGTLFCVCWKQLISHHFLSFAISTTGTYLTSWIQSIVYTASGLHKYSVRRHMRRKLAFVDSWQMLEASYLWVKQSISLRVYCT